MHRHNDGSAGDADYGLIGKGYTAYRRPDPAIASFLEKALGDAVTVLNIGAGAGSYEPTTRHVTAVEPSASMREQRPAHLSSAIDAMAEALPFETDSFDASMATFSAHQWVGSRERTCRNATRHQGTGAHPHLRPRRSSRHLTE